MYDNKTREVLENEMEEICIVNVSKCNGFGMFSYRHIVVGSNKCVPLSHGASKTCTDTKVRDFHFSFMIHKKV